MSRITFQLCIVSGSHTHLTIIKCGLHLNFCNLSSLTRFQLWLCRLLSVSVYLSPCTLLSSAGLHRGFGFVDFISVEAAAAAMGSETRAFGSIVCKGGRLGLEYSQPEPAPVPAPAGG